MAYILDEHNRLNTHISLQWLGNFIILYSNRRRHRRHCRHYCSVKHKCSLSCFCCQRIKETPGSATNINKLQTSRTAA